MRPVFGETDHVRAAKKRRQEGILGKQFTLTANDSHQLGAYRADPAHDPLPALSAWKIDQQHAKFVKIPTDGLLCPRSGIYTVDGGL